jgi:TP901 family phage tail tape measure protein
MMDIQQAIRNMQELNGELEKLKNTKLAGVVSEQINNDLKNAEKAISDTVNRINGLKLNNPLDKLTQSYSQHISILTKEAEQYFKLWKDTGNIEYKSKLDSILPTIKSLNAEQSAFNRLLQGSNRNATLLTNTFQQIKHHASFMASGALLGGAIALPAFAVHTMANIEQEMAGMLQTLPQLYKDYANHTVDQKALNEITHEFIDIAERYGFEVNKLIDAGKLWSRGYKDVETVMKLTGNSAKLAIADMMDVTLANRAVESTINSFKRQGDAVNFSNHIVDSWTNIAHNAQTSASDLAESMMRSAAAANVVGVSFDTASSLAATMIKNTGQSGAVVGNSLKAIYSNIHSDKGIADLEAMGIAVYEFDQKGTRHFRNVENVLIDLMIKTQGAKENLEELMQHVSGGRFQWNRAAALFGDYNEFIKNYNLSIQSAGVADKQVLAQLDTITRKAAQVKASMENLLMGTADAGTAAYIKSWLDSTNSLLKGLQQIPTGVYEVIGSMTKYAVILYTASTAVKYLESGLIGLTVAKVANATATTAEAVALTAEATAANAASVATGRLATVTTMATGGLNLLLAGLIAAGTGATLYASNVGEAVGQSEKLKQHNEDLVVVRQQELEMNQKQTEFIGTLGNAYNELQSKLQAVQGDEEKSIQVKNSLQATEEELKRVIGESGVERLKASNFSIEAIKSEQETHSQAATSIKTEIEQLKIAQNEFTDKQITAVEKRIDSLYKETEALSIWRKAQLSAYDFYAGLMEKQISFKKTLFNNMPNFMMAEKSQLAASITEDEAYRESLRVTSREGVNDDIAAAKAELAKLRKERLVRSIENYPTSSTIGGSEVGDGTDTKKKKGKGEVYKNPPDNSDEIFRREKGYEVDHMFKEAKIATDQYSQSIDILNAKENIFGFSTDNVSRKLELMNKRALDLMSHSMEYEDLASDYEQQANDMVASNQTLVAALDKQKVSWKDLSKEERQSFIQKYRDYIQDEKNLLRLLELVDKLRVASSDSAKDANRTGIDAARLSIDTKEKEYQQNMSLKQYDAKHGIAGLGRNATQQQKNLVELKYVVEQLALAQNELNRVESVYGKDNIKYKQQQQVVDELKVKVEELGDKWQGVRSQLADFVVDMAQNGSSLSQIWKRIFADFEREAIQRLFRVGNVQQSLLGSVLNLFGGGSSASVAQFGGNRTGISNNLLPTSFGHATGGIFNQQHLAMFAEGNKKEAIIPLEENRQRALGIWMESGKQLGAFKGTEVVPQMSPATVEAVNKANIAQAEVRQNKAHIQELEKQTSLLQTVVQALVSGNNNGSGQIAVIQTQVDAQTILQVLQHNPDALQQIMNNNSSLGYR